MARATINKIGKQWTVFIVNGPGGVAMPNRQAAIEYAVEHRCNVFDSRGKRIKGTPWFVDSDIYVEDLPRDCIAECSAQGSANESVEYWVKKLNMRLTNVDRARDYLKDCGFVFEKPDLDEYGEDDERPIDDFIDDDSDRITQIVLWLACCEFNEFLTWCDEHPNLDRDNCPFGTDQFHLGV